MPLDTIRRLIRTAAMVRPILLALEQRTVSAAPVMSQAPSPDDPVQRQADAMIRWVDDD